MLRSRWASRSSKPVAGCIASRGGFDSHAFPPFQREIQNTKIRQKPIFIITIFIMENNQVQTSSNKSSSLDEEKIHTIIKQYFKIEGFYFGDDESKYILRYFGKLISDDSETIYDQVKNQLTPFDLTPVFREESEKQWIDLYQGIEQEVHFNPRINLVLFLITLLSVWITGGIYASEVPLNEMTLNQVPQLLFSGWPFAISILAILGAHEMGHYLVGKKHGVNVSLPYFIPLPIISPFGTMGAFINMKSIPKNKKQLFDIGIAGPLSGLIIAIPVLLIGLSLSEVSPLPVQIPEGTGYQLEGNSILYLFLKFIVFGKLLPSPVTYGEMGPVIYWIKYFFTGQPIPFGGLDVMIHQVAWAGWAGILVTAMNLIPVGQLDGGHILNTLLGKKARRTVPFILGGMVALGFAWPGWWLWAVLIYMLAKIPAQPLDGITKLDKKRKILAVLMMIIFLLVFIPVPLILVQ